MELLQLKYFCRAAELENFAKVADEFHVPRESISQSIKRLESEVGKKLFDRRANSVHLNEQGKRIYTTAKSALTMLNDAKKELNDGEVSGQINLLTISARPIVLNAVKEYLIKYPNVSFTIDYSTEADIKKYDLIITDNMGYVKDLEEVELISDKMMLAVSDKNPLSKKNKIYIEDLKNEKIVTYCRNNGLYHITKKICNLKNFEPDVAIHCDEIEYILMCVGLNIGVSIVPSVSWKDFINSDVKLKKIEDLPSDYKEKKTSLFYSKDKYISKATKLFIDEMLRTANKYAN